ncbi:hypothetical protein ACFLXC_04565 [Chloroflexota bacterium]
MALEDLGKPTILYADGDFAKLGRMVATSKGSPMLPIAHVPPPIGGLGEKNNKSAEDVIQDVINALTRMPVEAAGKGGASDDVITVSGNDYFEAVNNMNELFTQKKWSDALPVVPPTPEAVAKMLKGTSHSPDEVVGVIEQRKGIATVKVVAINAVMAGCKPEHLPVVLAAVKASTDPAHNLYGVQATTAPAVPCLVVNGPVRKELSINCAKNCWGPGNPANSPIGRAFNLVMIGVGGRLECTMTSFGDGGRYSWCFGEYEEELPPGWLPLHVDKGYKPEESTVSIINVHWRSPIHGFFAPTTDEQSVDHLAESIMLDSPHWYGEYMVTLAPEIAAQVARIAPTKYELKKMIMEKTKQPWRILKERQQAKIGDFPPKGVTIPSDDYMLSPIMSKPEELNVVVCGGASRHSYFLVPWIRTHTITESIDAWK